MHCRHRRLILGSLSLALFSGCDGPRERTLEIVIPPYEVALGEERLRCHVMTLPSDEDIDIVRFTSRSSNGMHHVHVYESARGDTGALAHTYECPNPVSSDDWHLLSAVQMEGIDWTLPEGTAIHVKAGRSLLVQTHWLNLGGDGPGTTKAEGSLTLGLAEPGSITRHAGALFGQIRDINIPPSTTATIQSTCPLPAPGSLLAVMGHYHGHGTKFQAWTQDAGQPPSIFYDSQKRAEPPWTTFDDLRFFAGTRLGWSCEYNNPTAQPLHQGSNTSNAEEHCHLFAFHTLDAGDAAFMPCADEP